MNQKLNLVKRKKANNGITLIALVITIIVLLILAGVTIAAISGNEGVLDKAQSAKNKTDVANAKEAAMLKTTEYVQEFYQKKYVTNDSSVAGISNAGAYIAGKYATAVQTGSYYIQKDSTTGKIKVSTDAAGSNVIVEGTLGDNGTITWSDEVASGGGGGPVEDITKVSETEKEITYSVTSFDKISSITLPSTKNTIVTKGTGDTQQQVVIPAGFKLASDSGTTIEAGMVIEDASKDKNGQPTKKTGNQFVWVPVGQTVTYSSTYNGSSLKTTLGETATSGTITLSRYDFGSKESPTITPKGAQDPIGTYFTENASAFNYTVDETSYSAGASVARDIEDFKTKTKAAKGFYIGRYEMGKYSSSDSTSVCQANKPVYNNIVRGDTSSGALKEARDLYGVVTNKYASDLVNSYAWDTAIVFIEKCGGNSNYAFQNALTTSGPLSTGTASDGTNNDKQCNIFDMASNVVEWTTEYSSHPFGNDTHPCVYRGGSYSYSGVYTLYRYLLRTTESYNDLGFRPLLYIL